MSLVSANRFKSCLKVSVNRLADDFLFGELCRSQRGYVPKERNLGRLGTGSTAPPAHEHTTMAYGSNDATDDNFGNSQYSVYGIRKSSNLHDGPLFTPNKDLR